MSELMRAYYGFSKTPFTRTIPPSALHRHTGHLEAVARITWCITERGLGIVTGEVGAGKTVAVRAAITDLDASRHQVIYLPNPAIGTTGIYEAIITALGATPAYRKALLVAQARDLLAAEDNERGRLPLLVIDEAHLLAREQLEEIRMLTNSDMDSRSPLAVILIGQPTLRRQIKLGTFAALDQRITVRAALEGMSKDETTSYITHHLRFAGRADTLFSDDATALIHQASRGLPRAINNLAFASLTAAFFTKKTIVDEKTARQALTEINAE
jgi:type II secretory pathway predicted ATPase ExeA